MVKTKKRSSQPSKKKGKADSRIRSRSGKINPQKRRRRGTKTTRQSSKATGRPRTKKRVKMPDVII